LELAEAKNLVDELILGHAFTMDFESESDAATFVRAANELGVLASWRAPVMNIRRRSRGFSNSESYRQVDGNANKQAKGESGDG
jgi:hypothetical protein